MKEKRRFLKAAANVFATEAQLDTFESFRLHMDHTGELEIKGCTRVTVCTPAVMRLSCGDRDLTIEGTDLCIRVYSQTQTVVAGAVSRIEFHTEANT